MRLVVVGQGRTEHGMGKGPSVGYWDTAGPAVPRMCLLSATCLPCAMCLTLCQPRSKVAGRRAGGSCGALQGPNSTRSARAAGQGYCSTAQCLLGR